jgi:hypothetical protein
MTIDIADTPVRLRSPADVVDAVPYLVGFQPDDSVVVISLRGKRSRLGVVARFDLPTPRGATQRADEALGYLRRDGARRTIVVCYPPADGPAHPSVRPVADALTHRLTSAGIKVAEALCVCDGRWWSLQCDGVDCCPPEGTPLEGGRTSTLAAAMAVHGRVTFASREQLARTVEPVGGLAGAAMREALPRVRAQLNGRVAAGRATEVASESLEFFHEAVRHRLAIERCVVTALAVDDAARLIVGLDDVHVRDKIIAWAVGERGLATRSLFAELVPRAVRPFDVVPLTVLAWIAFLQGNGALAGIAVDRALEADPRYQMARILDEALRVGLNPSRFRSSLRELGSL